ncbi:hypothetical protein IAC76_09160 [Spirochaetes bacterium]|uniref:Uncharacterized protein n=1 Tax=Candidatus Scatousia excrementipullorum TaxID=2840936 RepID=A0A9D9H076_9BACT|nr:hypothetical protein [Candidatus Scatousia excrementipullorum]
MGKIFGISDNPVSTIESALKPLELKVEPSNIYPVKYLNRDTDKTDKFISKEKQNKPNAFIRMRNGIGRLMSHFSHPKNN